MVDLTVRERQQRLRELGDEALSALRQERHVQMLSLPKSVCSAFFTQMTGLIPVCKSGESTLASCKTNSLAPLLNPQTQDATNYCAGSRDACQVISREVWGRAPQRSAGGNQRPASGSAVSQGGPCDSSAWEAWADASTATCYGAAHHAQDGCSCRRAFGAGKKASEN